MKKNIMLLSVCFIIVVSMILLNIPSHLASGAAAKSYSLNEAIDRALDANMELDLLSEKIALAQKRRDTAGSVADLEKRKLEKTVTDLIWEKDQKEKSLKVDVAELYYKILINQRYIDLQTVQIERLEKEYELKKIQVELGNYTPYDKQVKQVGQQVSVESSLEKIQVELGNYTPYDKQIKQVGQQVSVESSLAECAIAVEEAKNKLASLKNDREELVMQLNREMGDEIEQNLILKNQPIPDEKLDWVDLKEVAQYLSLHDYSVEKLRKEKSLNEEERSSASGDKREELEDSILKLGYDIEDKEYDIKLKVWTDYNNIQNLEDDITIKKLDYEKCVKLSDIANLKYEMGMITFLEYAKALEDRDNAFCAYEEARLNYYIAVKRYKDFIKPAL